MNSRFQPWLKEFFTKTICLTIPTHSFAAKEDISSQQNFSLVWQAPWSIPKIVLFIILCYLLYSIISNKFFAWLLNKHKPADSCVMPQKAFKLTIISTLISWMILFGLFFGLTSNQELRITLNVIPGGKTVFLVNYLDNYMFLFSILCSLLILLLYIFMPAGEQRNSN